LTAPLQKKKDGYLLSHHQLVATEMQNGKGDVESWIFTEILVI
jgi:hypothetical protein